MGYTLQSGYRSEALSFTKVFDVFNKDLVITIDYEAFSTDNALSGGFVLGFLPYYRIYPDGTSAGAGMGYSSVSGLSSNFVDISAYGISYGQVGIGFDFSGKFSSLETGTGGTSSYNPNTVSIRGPASAYNLITVTSNLSTYSTPFTLFNTNSSLPSIKNARVRITDFGQRVIVDLKDKATASYTNYINVQLPTAISNYCRFYIGYASENTKNYFGIQNVNINGYDVTMQYLVSGAYYMGLSSSSSLLYPISSVLLNDGDKISIQNYFPPRPVSATDVFTISGVSLSAFTGEPIYTIPQTITTSDEYTLYKTYSALDPLINITNDQGMPYVANDGYVSIVYNP